MQKPTEQSVTNLKRLGRYLRKRSRRVQPFVEQTSTANVFRLEMYGGSDRAGCLRHAKSRRHGVGAQCTLSQRIKSNAINRLTQKW